MLIQSDKNLWRHADQLNPLGVRDKESISFCNVMEQGEKRLRQQEVQRITVI